jgi:hypothetical protein
MEKKEVEEKDKEEVKEEVKEAAIVTSEIKNGFGSLSQAII